MIRILIALYLLIGCLWLGLNCYCYYLEHKKLYSNVCVILKVVLLWPVSVVLSIITFIKVVSDHYKKY